MTLRVAVLGFAGAAPLDGACSSYVVSDGERFVLLDCGPGTVERLWRHRLLGRLDAIVISHMHADHVLDLLLFAGELVRRELKGRPRLYLPRDRGLAVLDAFDAAFSPGESRSRFEAAFDLAEYGAEDQIQVGELTLSFAPTAHPQPCFAVRVSDGEVALVYGADGRPSEALEQLAASADLLMLEATFANEAEAAATHGHMTAQQAGELASRADAQRLLLTHLLPGAGERLRALAKRHFDGRIDLAREELTYDLA